MPTPDPLLELLRDSSRRQAGSHAAFLAQRAAGLNDLAELIRLQTGQSGAIKKPHALFERAALEEFATGSISACFGAEYRIFENRRYPRIPNGELLLMDQVLDIHGTRHQLAPGSTITTQFRVPEQVWFGAFPDEPVPYFTLMELALQPCGLLSAYLGTSFLYPQADLYFRNLDGFGVLHRQPILLGKLITAVAELQSSTATGGTIIQKYAFRLNMDGQVFYEGESAFGYFPYATMAAQAGLDGGRSVPPRAGWEPSGLTPYRDPFNRLKLLDRSLFVPTSGEQPPSSWADRTIDPSDWFFKNHFYQDPVMPGSLGVEAAVQSLYSIASISGYTQSKPSWSYPLEQAVTWKYRGQILPTHQRMLVEVSLNRVESYPSGRVVFADANVWGDQLRLYSIQNLGLVFPSK